MVILDFAPQWLWPYVMITACFVELGEDLWRVELSVRFFPLSSIWKMEDKVQYEIRIPFKVSGSN